jgi:K+-transporting ATPase ATPase A chain
MSPAAAGLIQIGVLVTALAAVYVPLGDHMARVYSGGRHLRAERWIYKLVGVDPDSDQRWTSYARGLLAFSAVSVLFLYLLQRVQKWLPLNLGMGDVHPHTAFNTAASFVANTNWQSYSGESTMGHLVQMSGLAVQNFVSAAVGMAVAAALFRAFARRRADHLGNFWVDLVRGSLRILLPIAIIGTVVLVSAGVVQNLAAPHDVATLAGGAQHIPGGPVASQEVIKELGTNGGGFYNANSAHPFEDPTAFTSLFEIFLILVIPVALTRTFGTMVGSVKHGAAILAVMGTIFALSLAGITAAELSHGGSALHTAGGAMEGKETRFGVWLSALFATATTSTSTGAVNSFHDSFTPLGGGLTILNMALGEITPGGVGSGMYGMLVMAMLTVFLGGLMVGRTPEFLGKKLRSREIRLIALYTLTTPALVLTFTGIALMVPSARASMLNSGPHGFSEVLYAYTSGSNNNGSAFAGLSAGTPFYDTTIGMAMLFGRFVPIVFALALAGSLAKQRPVPVTAGTLPTYKPLFIGMTVAVVLIVTGLTFFPALALGPLAEGLS